MHTATHYHKQNLHIHELSKKLQNEINSILEKVDDSHLYAEFHDRELVEISDGVHHNKSREALDERINHNIARRSHRHSVSHVKKHSSHKNIDHTSKLNKLINFLFKPFEI